MAKKFPLIPLQWPSLRSLQQLGLDKLNTLLNRIGKQGLGRARRGQPAQRREPTLNLQYANENNPERVASSSHDAVSVRELVSRITENAEKIKRYSPFNTPPLLVECPPGLRKEVVAAVICKIADAQRVEDPSFANDIVSIVKPLMLVTVDMNYDASDIAIYLRACRPAGVVFVMLTDHDAAFGIETLPPETRKFGEPDPFEVVPSRGLPLIGRRKIDPVFLPRRRRWFKPLLISGIALGVILIWWIRPQWATGLLGV